MNNLLEIKNLRISAFDKKIIDGVNFSIKEGEIKALIGESGSGKSITALSLIGLLKYVGNFEVSGEIIYKQSTNIIGLSEKGLQKIRGSQIAMIFQDPMLALNPLHNVGKQIKESLLLDSENSNKTNSYIKEKILNLLDMVGLSGIKDRLNDYPHQFSGGQRQRIMILMAIARSPKLLIADEPTTALDNNVGNEVLELLKDLSKKNNLAILLITHDIASVKKIADNIEIIKEGKIVESGSSIDIFANPKTEYSKLLLSSSFYDDMIEYKNDNKEKVIEVENLSVSYQYKDYNDIKYYIFPTRKQKFILENITFSLNQKSNLGIIGESGSGKSTIALSIVKLIDKLNMEGKINFCGYDLLKCRDEFLRKNIRKDLQIILQDPFSSLNPRIKVRDVFLEVIDTHKLATGKQDKEQIMDDILIKVGLSKESKNLYPHQFSGGQRQRIAIARSLILKPKLLIFDEPTSALDVTNQKNIVSLLRNLQNEFEMTYIVISHDLRVIKALSHQIMVIKNGKVIDFMETKHCATS